MADDEHLSVPGSVAMSARQREITPDLIKGSAIFGVVLIHASGLFDQTMGVIAADATARVGVPLFVITWAYFAEKAFARGKSYRLWATDTLLTLGRIFLIWSAFYFLLSGDLHHFRPISFITRHLLGYGWSGQYFFWIVFLLIPFVPLLRYSIGRPPAWIAIAAFTLVLYILLGTHAIKLRYGLDQRILPFYWAGYTILGMALARSRMKVSMLCVLAVVLPPLTCLLDRRYDALESPYFTPAVLIAACLIAGALLNRRVVENAITRPLAALGQQTLGIFVVNPLVPLALHSYAPLGGGLPAALIFAAVETGVCWALAYGLARSPVAALIR